ncbi:MAG: hypothetical protein ABMA64_26305 [Myxococcota bacterium]
MALSTPALAGTESADALAELREAELPVIAETGIAAFDSVFMKAKAIHDTLDSVQGRILGSQDKIAVSVGLTEGTPIRMTMWELKQKAGGPIAVEMRDGKPYLTLGGAGADEAKAMLEAVNLAATDLAAIPNDLAQLPPQVQELVAACQAFPGQLNPSLLTESGLNPLQLPKIAKTLANNIKAVGATPKRIENLVAASQDLLTGIPQGLAATEPPTEAVAVADVGKGDKGADKGGDAPKPEKEPKADKPAKDSGTSDGWQPTPIAGMVSDALAAFQDAEVDSAMKLLGDADASLARLSAPISSRELSTLYETASLVQLVDGNAAAATANAVQAMIVDPYAKPASELGPEYAKLHKALLKSGVVNVVRIDVTGTGTAYLSGRPIEAGGSVDIATGKHLLQRQVGGKWVSELIWVSEGTAIEL